MVNADNRADAATRKVSELCRWDRVMYGASLSAPAQGQYLLGKISLGQYAQWKPEALERAGQPSGAPILATMTQANFIDGRYNDEPRRWCATTAEAEQFIERTAAELLRLIAVKLVESGVDAAA